MENFVPSFVEKTFISMFLLLSLSSFKLSCLFIVSPYISPIHSFFFVSPFISTYFRQRFLYYCPIKRFTFPALSPVFPTLTVYFFNARNPTVTSFSSLKNPWTKNANRVELKLKGGLHNWLNFSYNDCPPSPKCDFFFLFQWALAAPLLISTLLVLFNRTFSHRVFLLFFWRWHILRFPHKYIYRIPFFLIITLCFAILCHS